MRFIYSCLLAISLLLAGRAQVNAQKADVEVRRTIDQLFTSMRTGDSTLARSVFTKQGSLTSYSRDSQDSLVIHSSPLDGLIRAIGTAHKEIWDEQIYNVQIWTDYPVAVVWAPYKFFLGGTFSHCGVNVFTMVHIGNEWKINDIKDTRRKTACK